MARLDEIAKFYVVVYKRSGDPGGEYEWSPSLYRREDAIQVARTKKSLHGDLIEEGTLGIAPVDVGIDFDRFEPIEKL
jgi:hypothetical protein